LTVAPTDVIEKMSRDSECTAVETLQEW
jgi:hypothetical protein